MPNSDLSKKEIRYFNIAKEKALLSDHRCKIGAVVVYKHKIISWGRNSAINTDIIQAQLDSIKYNCPCEGKLHAESDALIYFIKKGISLKGAEIYVYRKLANGNSAMARPCSSCMKLIRQCGIRKIHYTTNDGFATEILM